MSFLWKNENFLKKIKIFLIFFKKNEKFVKNVKNEKNYWSTCMGGQKCEKLWKKCDFLTKYVKKCHFQWKNVLYLLVKCDFRVKNGVLTCFDRLWKIHVLKLNSYFWQNLLIYPRKVTWWWKWVHFTRVKLFKHL
jgi:hypothetical protein